MEELPFKNNSIIENEEHEVVITDSKLSEINAGCVVVDDLYVSNAIKLVSLEMASKVKMDISKSLSIVPFLFTLLSKHMCLSKDSICRDKIIFSNQNLVPSYYSIIHLMTKSLSIDDLKYFGDFNSKTPTYPNINTSYIDYSVSNYGNFAGSLGMSIGEKFLESKYNAKYKIFNNKIFYIFNNIEDESFYSLLKMASDLKLSNLIMVYSNEINKQKYEDFIKNFINLDFNALKIENCNDFKEIDDKILNALSSTKPSVIFINTILDNFLEEDKIYNLDEISALRIKLNQDDEPFSFNKDIYKFLDKRIKQNNNRILDFNKILKRLKWSSRSLYNEIINFTNKNYKYNIVNQLKKLGLDDCNAKSINHNILNKLYKIIPNVMSVYKNDCQKEFCKFDGVNEFNIDYKSPNLDLGQLSSSIPYICNGLSCLNILPIFSDNLSNASSYYLGIRQGAIMNLKTIYSFYDENIDCPNKNMFYHSTYELGQLRQIFNTLLFRPNSFNEYVGSYGELINYNCPSIIISPNFCFERLENSKIDEVKNGAYILSKAKSSSVVSVIIASGKECAMAIDVQKILRDEGYESLVVSCPCTQLFDKLNNKLKNKILPTNIKSIVVIENASDGVWYKYIGKFGKVFGINDFVMEGKEKDLINKFNLTSYEIAKSIINLAKENQDWVESLLYIK
jgi:transketolase